MKELFHRFLLFFSKVLLGCLLGCIMLLFYASRSEVVRQEIKKSLQKTFKEQFDCDWDGQVESIDLLALNIQFNHVSFLPCNRADGWSLYTDKFYISASLFQFIFYRHFSCHGIFDQIVIYEKQAAEKSHFVQVLSKMFFGQLPSNVSFDYICVKQGQVILEDATGCGKFSYHYNCQTSCERDGLHTKLYLVDGDITYKDQIIFEKIFGSFISIVPYDNDLQEIYARVDCRLSVPALQEKGSCFFLGDLYRSHGAFVLSNEDQSFIIEPLKIKLKPHSMPFNCAISIESQLVQKILAQKIIDQDITGNATLAVMGNLLDLSENLQGSLQIQNVAYKNNSLLDHAVLTFKKQDNGYATKLLCNHESWFEGFVKSLDQDFSFDIHNVRPFQLLANSYWNIPADHLKLSGFIERELFQVKGHYHADLESIKLDDVAKAKGFFELNEEKLRCKGFFEDKNYSCSIAWLPTPHLVELSYKSGEESLIDFHEHQDSSQGTIGSIEFSFVKSWLTDMYKSSFSQPGKFLVHGQFENDVYQAQVSTSKAHIRIPSLYNVVQDFKATTSFNFINRSIIIDAMVAHLYEGVVHCDHAIINFDSSAQTSFLYIPLTLENMLMSWNKGIFGIVSGRLFLSQQQQKVLELQGHLMVDKAELKGNIFSQEFQDQLVGAVGSSQGVDLNCNLDITVETKEPIIVETSFLQAMVHLDLHLGHTLKQPEIEGSIDIASGELKFPYKSLFITHGQILLMPKRSTDPTIEFIAKGKIKRYDITMRATGTVMDQQIHFESSPYLTEEQIISLLLTGSQDSSLSAVMPAMFMQKLHEIVFGPAISKSKLDVIFNRLLQSFKNIRIFPQFTNQTGRGGVRGVIEIDATDRLHGRIDSNLMQLEDTIFEADYLVTDDVTLRAIKDGPSTYGGEVEMRWKFS